MPVIPTVTHEDGNQKKGQPRTEQSRDRQSPRVCAGTGLGVRTVTALFQHDSGRRVSRDLTLEKLYGKAFIELLRGCEDKPDSKEKKQI